MAKRAFIAGATGLIGSFLLEKLLADDRYEKVVALVRKELPPHDKLEQVVLVDFDQLESINSSLKADDVFCCLGTTIAKAESKENFKKIDLEAPVKLAEMARANGAQQYLVVSALGADKNSRIFYNQVKGEMEEQLKDLGYETVHIFRPSLLYGPRKEKRTGEDAAKRLYKAFSFIFRGPLKKYDGIEAEQVAKAMLHYARQEKTGIYIHESIDLQKI